MIGRLPTYVEEAKAILDLIDTDVIERMAASSRISAAACSASGWRSGEVPDADSRRA